MQCTVWWKFFCIRWYVMTRALWSPLGVASHLEDLDRQNNRVRKKMENGTLFNSGRKWLFSNKCYIHLALRWKTSFWAPSWTKCKNIGTRSFYKKQKIKIFLFPQKTLEKSDSRCFLCENRSLFLHVLNKYYLYLIIN